MKMTPQTPKAIVQPAAPPKTPVALDSAETAEPATTADTAVRTRALVTLPNGRTNLGAAFSTAQAITVDAKDESALADLVRAAALSTDDVFAKALAGYKAPTVRGGLRALLSLRAEAIAEEHGDPAGFLARVALIGRALT
jgi:hypothetical protein